MKISAAVLDYYQLGLLDAIGHGAPEGQVRESLWYVLPWSSDHPLSEAYIQGQIEGNKLLCGVDAE